MITLWQGDCLELMKDIPDHSIDCIICDLPYGVTQNPWDSVIDLEDLWKCYKRVITPNGAIILFGQDKFTMKVIQSNESWHRYNLIWNKETPTGFLNANRMPLRVHEDIMIFYENLPVFNPQKYIGNSPSHARCKKNYVPTEEATNNHNYGSHMKGDFNAEVLNSNMKFPTSIISCERVPTGKCVHPTQKPVALIEYLIRTYTNEGATILDNCMGSGTVGVACKNLHRNFIGIELDEKYFKIAEKRIRNANPFNI